MTRQVQMAFARHKLMTTHIQDVETGNTDCTCIKCGQNVIPKKGKILQHHFAHASLSECQGYNPETLLHKRAKMIVYAMLKTFGIYHIIDTKNNTVVRFKNSKGGVSVKDENNSISIPDHRYNRTVPLNYTFGDGIEQTMFPTPKSKKEDYTVQMEKQAPVGKYTPDVSVLLHNCILINFIAIEIVVTHGMDKERLLKSANNKHMNIKIDLSDVDRDINTKDLKDILKNRGELLNIGVEPSRYLRNTQISKNIHILNTGIRDIKKVQEALNNIIDTSIGGYVPRKESAFERYVLDTIYNTECMRDDLIGEIQNCNKDMRKSDLDKAIMSIAKQSNLTPIKANQETFDLHMQGASNGTILITKTDVKTVFGGRNRDFKRVLLGNMDAKSRKLEAKELRAFNNIENLPLLNMSKAAQADLIKNLDLLNKEQGVKNTIYMTGDPVHDEEEIDLSSTYINF